MKAPFWQLPGPSSYVEKIHYDLTDCKNVVAVLTRITPDGLHDRLQDSVEGSGLGWSRVYERPGPGSPAQWLAARFGEKLSPWATPVDMRDNQAFAGTTFVVDLPDDPAVLGDWAAFMQQYAQACGGVDNYMVPRLLAFWPGPDFLPVSDMRLSVHHWSGVLDSTDIHLLAALKMRRAHLSPLARNLSAALAAKVSGGDPLLCEQLCLMSLAEMMLPHNCLRKYAEEMGWDPTELASEHRGTLVRVDNTVREHPALLATQRRDKEVEALVWSAQVGVLMPLIEERRQEIIGRLEGSLVRQENLRPGHTSREVDDLEIGQIHYQINNLASHVPRNIKEQVGRLRRVRDSLAHREALPAEFLLDEFTVRALTKTV